MGFAERERWCLFCSGGTHGILRAGQHNNANFVLGVRAETLKLRREYHDRATRQAHSIIKEENTEPFLTSNLDSSVNNETYKINIWILNSKFMINIKDKKRNKIGNNLYIIGSRIISVMIIIMMMMMIIIIDKLGNNTANIKKTKQHPHLQWQKNKVSASWRMTFKKSASGTLPSIR